MNDPQTNRGVDITRELTATLLLTPVWWILGVNIFIYQLASLFVLVKLLGVAARHRMRLYLPRPAVIYLLFLISYLGSIAINAGNHPQQRVLASLNNYFVMVMGFLVLVGVYNSRETFFYKLFRVCSWLCFITGLLAIAALLMWCQGHLEMESLTLLGRMMPALVNYPYFKELLIIHMISTDWLQTALPRVALYSEVYTALGGFMLMVLPPMIAYFTLRRNKVLVWIVSLLALVPLIFSLSRTVICALVIGFCVVRFFEKGVKWPYLFLGVALVLVGINFVSEGVDWLLRLRNQSTVNRMEIYEDAIRIVWESNILMGIGIRIRSAYFMMSIGSHSTYIGLLLITGLLGLGLFILFQVSVFLNWYRQMPYLQDSTDRTAWRYLGVSFVGSNIWLLTDSLDALPFIAFTYFMIVGCILLLGKSLNAQHERAITTAVN